MRVTDVTAGGGAAPHPSAQATAPAQAQDTRPASTPAPAAAAAAAATEASGLSAAVLQGCVGDFYRAVEGMTNTLDDVELSLPQVVVVGQESSGKSSVLESVAMLPLFPRDSVMCTRLPVLLKLRHMSQSDVEVAGDPELMPHCNSSSAPSRAEQIHMRLLYADRRAPVASSAGFTRAQAAQLMRQWMDQIMAEQHADRQLRGVVEHVLEIEVTSPHVPSLNLLDLPGIVAGKLIDEPDDMMQRTRAIVEKYLQQPHTLVLAVVPASERVRNSQAFQLVQQYNLMDKTIGVLTMVDRALDDTNPDGPLAEVKSRLDGTSSDIVFLKQGYVAVKNRDSRAKTEVSLEEAKVEENAWLEENLPGYIDKGLASSSVLTAKIEKMLAEHVRTKWAPKAQAKIESELKRAEKKLANMGPDPQDMVNDFLGVYPTAARKRMLELVKPVLPALMSRVDEEILHLAALVHADFLKSREEHELILAPFQAKSKQKLMFGSGSGGSLMAASLLMMDSHDKYLSDHLVQILKNVVLHLVRLIQKTLEASISTDRKESTPQRLDRFGNLHLFFAGVLWEQLNELLIEDEELLRRIGQSFLEFDPENASILQLPTKIKMVSENAASELKILASNLELYLDSKGFQNTSLDEVYLPQASSSLVSLTRDMSRLIVSAEVPTLAKSRPCGFNAAASGSGISLSAAATGNGFGMGAAFPNGFTFGPATPKPKQEKPQELGEFELRLFFAITTHAVAPLLQSLCDVGDLARRMQEYVSCHPNVSGSKFHVFCESTSGKRKKYARLAKHLSKAAAALKSTPQLRVIHL